MTPEQEREAFEAWIRTGEEFEMQWLNRRDFRDSERFGDYCDNSIEWQWRAFKAGARASLAQPASVPAGRKLVPVEPTLAMLDALRADTTPYLPDRYRAMLAAAPQAPQPAQPDQSPAEAHGLTDEPAAWINWSALTGEPRLGWQCESEIASEPLYRKAKP